MILPFTLRHSFPNHLGWPEPTPTVQLPDGGKVRLRPLRFNDATDWCQQRLLDEAQLKPVETTVPEGWAEAHSTHAWWTMFFRIRKLARAGSVIPLVIEVDGKFAGQTTLGGIQHGTSSDCWIGYWVFSQYQRRGVATAACALGTDHAFYRVGLHRVAATYLPSNKASERVLHSCGFRKEGYLRSNLHINGQWRDHYLVALTHGELRGTCVRRLKEQGKLR
ncbi:GNAT family N-acetyltransferase [Corynebacterium poyangense]|uniref:GNAT family N-acetyltransferase n=1 Tax=Corynebacterium poyangense TaxID=2684405 RepID=A0A7H0SMV9_9CORY|nr:GNAT family protein [Corynebacterium poyangense]QNQ89884.1 GNAT family N-acetyltransferase [Corynebacterium poyangense]